MAAQTNPAIGASGTVVNNASTATNASGGTAHASSGKGGAGRKSGSPAGAAGNSGSRAGAAGKPASSSGSGSIDSSTAQALLFDEFSEIYDASKQAAQILGITKNSMKGATVFIKPNVLNFGLAAFEPEAGNVTKQEIVFGVAEMCLEAGAAKVSIGDGSATISFDWAEAIFLKGNTIKGATNIKAGIDYLKSKYGDSKVELLCLNEVDKWEYIPSSSTDDRVKDGLMIAKSFADADHVISIGVPKSHVYSFYTGALKNYFGVVPSVHLGMPNGVGRTKAHAAYYYATCAGVPNIGVTGAYMDTHKWRMDKKKKDFAILDCTVGIEGDGPNPPPINNGTTVDHKQRNKIHKYYLLASHDLVTADAIAAQILNFPFDSVKQFAVARNWKLGAIENAKLKGAALEDLIIRDWVKPVLIDEAMFLMTG